MNAASKSPAPASVKTIRARFASVCPQCKRAIAVGAPVACTHDNVWRCPDCTEVFSRLVGCRRGSSGRPVPFLTIADAVAAKARDFQIIASSPITYLWSHQY